MSAPVPPYRKRDLVGGRYLEDDIEVAIANGAFEAGASSGSSTRSAEPTSVELDEAVDRMLDVKAEHFGGTPTLPYPLYRAMARAVLTRGAAGRGGA